MRDAGSPAARDLHALGAELAVGDFEDRASLVRAMAGVRGVFSVQPENAPIAFTLNLCEAAKATHVQQCVQSTVSGTGLHEATPGWANPAIWPEYWEGRRPYWTHKHAQECTVRNAAFLHWSIIRPPMIIDNAIKYATVLFPRLASDGCILSCVPEDIAVPYISYASIGDTAAKIFADPDRFSSATLEISDEELTDGQLADALSSGTGRPVRALHLSPARAMELGLSSRIVTQHQWLGDIGYPARAAAARLYGLAPLPIAEWAHRNAARIAIGNLSSSVL